MKMPDFTKPSPYATKLTIKGTEVWVPRSIKYQNGHWLIAVNRRTTQIQVTHPLKSLEDAWLLLQARNEREQPDNPKSATPGRKKDIDTGVIGVRVSIQDKHVRVWTQQKLSGERHRQCPVASIPVDRLSQQWLDKALADACSIRYYYLFLSMEVPVATAIRYCDVPPEHRLDEPTHRVSIWDVLSVAREKELARFPHGHKVVSSQFRQEFSAAP